MQIFAACYKFIPASVSAHRGFEQKLLLINTP